MLPKWSIVIPSKGRPRAATFSFLSKCHPNHPAFVFVESADVATYRQSCHLPLLELEESGRGIGYSRHCIVKWASSQGYEYVFMLDDDISGMLIREDFRKYRKLQGSNFFEEALEVAQREKISNLVCMHNFNIRYCDQIFTTNSCAAGFILLNVKDAMDVGNFDPNRRLYEDAELHVRMLIMGKRVVRWNQYAYSTPPDTNKRPREGGCSEEYQKYLVESQDSLIAQYPGVFSVMQKNGMPKLRTSWKTANSLFGVGIEA